jgi:hypothetical protein
MNTALEIAGDAVFMGSGPPLSRGRVSRGACPGLDPGRSAGMTRLETWAGRP